MNKHKLTPETNALRKFDAPEIMGIQTPAGHILSVMVEELEIENPNLPEMLSDINRHISIGGNGFAKIKSLSDTFCYGSKAHWGLSCYINERNINEEIKKRVQYRIKDELIGIIPEDRIFERDGTFERYRSN
jgi:hypothetical protein